MISINGTDIEPKSLTLPQVRACRKAEGDEADALAIAWSCGVDVAVAREWFNTVSAGVASDALREIFVVSGLAEGASKSV